MHMQGSVERAAGSWGKGSWWGGGMILEEFVGRPLGCRGEDTWEAAEGGREDLMLQVRDDGCPLTTLGSVASRALSWPQDHEGIGVTEAGVSAWVHSHLI